MKKRSQLFVLLAATLFIIISTISTKSLDNGQGPQIFSSPATIRLEIKITQKDGYVDRAYVKLSEIIKENKETKFESLYSNEVDITNSMLPISTGSLSYTPTLKFLRNQETVEVSSLTAGSANIDIVTDLPLRIAGEIASSGVVRVFSSNRLDEANKSLIKGKSALFWDGPAQKAFQEHEGFYQEGKYEAAYKALAAIPSELEPGGDIPFYKGRAIRSASWELVNQFWYTAIRVAESMRFHILALEDKDGVPHAQYANYDMDALRYVGFNDNTSPLLRDVVEGAPCNATDKDYMKNLKEAILNHKWRQELTKKLQERWAPELSKVIMSCQSGRPGDKQANGLKIDDMLKQMKEQDVQRQQAYGDHKDKCAQISRKWHEII